MQPLDIARFEPPLNRRLIEAIFLEIGGLVGNDLVGAQPLQAAHQIVELGALGVGLRGLDHLPVAVAPREDNFAWAARPFDPVGAGKADEIAVREIMDRREQLPGQFRRQHHHHRPVVDHGKTLIGFLVGGVLREIADLDDMLAAQIFQVQGHDGGLIEAELLEILGREGGDAFSLQPGGALEQIEDRKIVRIADDAGLGDLPGILTAN